MKVNENVLVVVPKERTVSLTAPRRASSVDLHRSMMCSTLSVAWHTRKHTHARTHTLKMQQLGLKVPSWVFCYLETLKGQTGALLSLNIISFQTLSVENNRLRRKHRGSLGYRAATKGCGNIHLAKTHAGLPCSWSCGRLLLCRGIYKQLCWLCGWSRPAGRRGSAACTPVGGGPPSADH